MSMNPFLAVGSPFDMIEREDCQRIHYHAIQAAARGIRPHAIPESLPLAALLESARLNGAETYLFHPADIESLFVGVTLAVYRTIRTLYCSRLGRSIEMVWRILSVMATDAGATIIPYEAVWALCLHMEELRRQSVEVQIERGKDIWWIGQTTPDITIQEGQPCDINPPSPGALRQRANRFWLSALLRVRQAANRRCLYFMMTLRPIADHTRALKLDSSGIYQRGFLRLFHSHRPGMVLVRGEGLESKKFTLGFLSYKL